MSESTTKVDHSGGDPKKSTRAGRRIDSDSSFLRQPQALAGGTAEGFLPETTAIRVDSADAAPASRLISGDKYWASSGWRVRVFDGSRTKWINLTRPFALIGSHPCCALRIRGLHVPEVAYIACCLRNHIEVWPTAPIAFPRWGVIDSQTEVVVGPCSMTFHHAADGDQSFDGRNLHEADSLRQRNPRVAEAGLPSNAAHLADSEVETCFFWSGNELPRTLRRPVTVIGDDHPSILRLHKCGMGVCNFAAVVQDQKLWLLDLSAKMMKRRERVRRFEHPGDRMMAGDAEMELVSIRAVVRSDRSEASAVGVAERVHDDPGAQINLRSKLHLIKGNDPVGDLSAETAWNRINETLGLIGNVVEDSQMPPTDDGQSSSSRDTSPDGPDPSPGPPDAGPHGSLKKNQLHQGEISGEEDRESAAAAAAAADSRTDADGRRDSLGQDVGTGPADPDRQQPSHANLMGVDRSDGRGHNECNDIEGSNSGAEPSETDQESLKFDEFKKPGNENSQSTSSTNYDSIDVSNSTRRTVESSRSPFVLGDRLGSLLVAFRGAVSAMNKIVPIPITVFRRSHDGGNGTMGDVDQSQTRTSDDFEMSAIDQVMRTTNPTDDVLGTLEVRRSDLPTGNDSIAVSAHLPKQGYPGDTKGSSEGDAELIASGLTMRLSKLSRSRGAKGRTWRRLSFGLSLVLVIVVLRLVFFFLMKN